MTRRREYPRFIARRSILFDLAEGSRAVAVDRRGGWLLDERRESTEPGVA